MFFSVLLKIFQANLVALSESEAFSSLTHLVTVLSLAIENNEDFDIFQKDFMVDPVFWKTADFTLFLVNPFSIEALNNIILTSDSEAIQIDMDLEIEQLSEKFDAVQSSVFFFFTSAIGLTVEQKFELVAFLSTTDFSSIKIENMATFFTENVFIDQSLSTSISEFVVSESFDTLTTVVSSVNILIKNDILLEQQMLLNWIDTEVKGESESYSNFMSDILMTIEIDEKIIENIVEEFTELAISVRV